MSQGGQLVTWLDGGLVYCVGSYMCSYLVSHVQR